MKQTTFGLIATALVSFSGVASAQDDFEDGTTQNWTTGGNHPSPPVNVADGGPAGSGDNYLSVTASGSGPGGKLVFFKFSGEYVGDWTAAGFDQLKMDVANFGATPLELRASVNGPGGWISTTSSVNVPADGVWRTIAFDVTESGFTLVSGSLSISSTLASVSETRLLHSTTPDFRGDNIVADAGFDNIDLMQTTSDVGDWWMYE